MDAAIADIEERVAECAQTPQEANLLRSLFVSAYQIRRAILERAFSPGAGAAQRTVLAIFDAVEPGSFEHCKSAAIALLYARHVGHDDDDDDDGVEAAALRALRLRYGAGDAAFQVQVLQRICAVVDGHGSAEADVFA